ncbi:hypothetical protein ACFLXA_01560 [Chloroflexota bacterium]
MAINKGKSVWEKMNNDPRIGSFIQIIIHLNQYLFALNESRRHTSSKPLISTPSTFYIEALWNMIGNWFVIKGRTSPYLLETALSPIGLEEHLKPFDKLLNSPIGNTTWREVVREMRNAQCTHEIFNGNVQRRIYYEFGINKDLHGVPISEIARENADFFDKIGELIRDLQAQVELAFLNYDNAYYMLLRQKGFYNTVLSDADITEYLRNKDSI